MIENRSVPPNTVLPHIQYRNLTDALAWLTKAFGFREQYRYGDPVSGVQMRLGAVWIMLSSAPPGAASPAELGYGTQMLTLFVDDVDAHFENAKAAGATIVEDLHETIYGERQYGAADPDGHRWLFSRHARDVSPDEWGAVVTETRHRIEMLPRPRFCYLQIPSVNTTESAAFYEKVFGWNIRHRESGHPSFDDATGNVSGAWTTDRRAAREQGLLPYIWVEDIETTLARVEAHGGEIVQPAAPDQPGGASLIALFRDLVGNLIGLYQESN